MPFNLSENKFCVAFQNNANSSIATVAVAIGGGFLDTATATSWGNANASSGQTAVILTLNVAT